MTTSGEDINKPFGTITSGSVYLGFLLQVSAAQDAGDYFMHLGPNTIGSTFRARVFAKKTGTGYALGILKTGNGGVLPTYDTQVLDFNKTYWVVVKYVFNPLANDDEALLYVSPQVGAGEPKTAQATAIVNDLDAETNIGSVALRQGSAANAATLRVDALRVGTNWAAVATSSNAPIISVSKSSLAQFIGNTAAATSPQTYEITGTNLTDNILITAPTNFEIRKLNDAAFGATITLSQTNGSVPLTTIETRMKPIAGSFLGNITHTSAGALAKTVSVTGVINDLNNIKTITIANARTQSINTLVSIAGRITVGSQFGNLPFLQDGTGGIPIFSDVMAAAVTIGDSVVVIGQITTFNNQIQIGSTNLSYQKIATAAKSVQPKTVTLADLSKNEGMLVSIADLSFEDKRFVFTPNSNFVVNVGTAIGELRINASTNLVGRTKPQATGTVVGVVGRFKEVYQLMPRFLADVPNTGVYAVASSNVPRNETINVASWNVLWFGNLTNGPSDEPLQMANVKQVMDSLRADIYVLQEVANPKAFKDLVGKLSGYKGFCSTAISGGSTLDDAQRVCFIYKTSVIDSVSAKPLLKGAVNLPNYPNNLPDRFWASGRLPYLFVADATANTVKKRLHIIGIHARANTGGTTATLAEKQLQYDQRKYDIKVLKDTLDAQYANANVLIMGDYNDDVDETVSEITSTKESTYKIFVDDDKNFKVLTKTLSDNGFRSYISQTNMIDHITVSNDLFTSVLAGSESVELAFRYIANYQATTSDHIPVLARLKFIIPPPPITSLEALQDLNVRVFPNPSMGAISLAIDEDQLKGKTLKATMYNAYGQIISDTNGTLQEVNQQINKGLGQGNLGLYLLKVSLGQQNKVIKILKQ
jgi:endonuclease/exonuclease/phosphatase family metal-dependent hydrolase